ncbi:ABC transporter substrate-binding protein [Klebsiella spallanzanii]|uniref:ABC transporter substrate-binding protein n=1 Tax=Klebsiella spallanzanii TaxID=2587528 RepID=UPI00111BA775|nr:ABC transporter substrate-binding protein [Klebsiella spallanzanii]
MNGISRRACLQALFLLPLAAHAGLTRLDNRRIVAINWAAAETLLSIGVTPLAISDSRYFRRRIPRPVLPESVLDVGPFWEPNMEMLDALRPSLIISDVLPAATMAKMAQIAPVETVSAYSTPGDLWEGLRDWTEKIAARLEAGPAAARWLRQSQAEMSGFRLRLTARPGLRVLVMVLDQDGKYATIYGNGSLADAVIRQLGLINAWQKPVNSIHVARVRIEELADLTCDWLFYTELPTTMTRLMRTRQSNGLWRHLPIVAEQQVTRLEHFFPFGSLATALGLAGEITRILEREN